MGTSAALATGIAIVILLILALVALQGIGQLFGPLEHLVH